MKKQRIMPYIIVGQGMIHSSVINEPMTLTTNSEHLESSNNIKKPKTLSELNFNNRRFGKGDRKRNKSQFKYQTKR